MTGRQREKIYKIAFVAMISGIALLIIGAICVKALRVKTPEGNSEVAQQEISSETATAASAGASETRGATSAGASETRGDTSAGASETRGKTGSESGEDEKSEPEINLRMVGDILLHTPVEESARQANGSYDFSSIFRYTKEDIEQADLAIVNQEVIIGGQALGVSGYPAFNAPYEVADELVETGFDLICHGTNHALDKGKKGILNCLDNWETKYPEIGVVGINDSKEDRDNIYVYEKAGIKLAVLNYTYGTNGISLPSGMPYAVNLLEENQVEKDIKKAHELADFVVVCPHWGTEYSLEVSEEQKRWTKIFLDNHVDLVIGTHPHVIEKYEMISEGDKQMLVYYSLGNFVNWTSGQGAGVANRMVGGMADVTIGYDNKNRVVIKDYGVIPLVCHVTSGKGGVTVYKLEDYTPELAAQNQIINQDSTFSYEYIKGLCAEIWPLEQ